MSRIRMTAFDWLLVILSLMVMATALVGCGDERVEPPRGIFKFQGGADVDALMIWLVSLSILGIGASIALSSFVGKKIASAGVAGFGAILAAALLVKAAIPFLPWVSLGLVVSGGGFLIWYCARQVRATTAAVGFGCAMAKADTELEAEKVREEQAKLQAAAGVKTIIDKTLEKFK